MILSTSFSAEKHIDFDVCMPCSELLVPAAHLDSQFRFRGANKWRAWVFPRVSDAGQIVHERVLALWIRMVSIFVAFTRLKWLPWLISEWFVGVCIGAQLGGLVPHFDLLTSGKPLILRSSP